MIGIGWDGIATDGYLGRVSDVCNGISALSRPISRQSRLRRRWRWRCPSMEEGRPRGQSQQVIGQDIRGLPYMTPTKNLIFHPSPLFTYRNQLILFLLSAF